MMATTMLVGKNEKKNRSPRAWERKGDARSPLRVCDESEIDILLRERGVDGRPDDELVSQTPLWKHRGRKRKDSPTVDEEPETTRKNPRIE